MGKQNYNVISYFATLVLLLLLLLFFFDSSKENSLAINEFSLVFIIF